MATPDGIDWDVHRIAASGRYADSLITIQTQWSLDDLYEAHDVLDMYDELERSVVARTQQARGARR